MGFSNIVGFIFTFFLVISVFAGIYVTFNKQVMTEFEIIENKKENLPIIQEKFEVSNFKYLSNDFSFEVKNLAKSNLFFKNNDNNFFCFTVFLNDEFINYNNISVDAKLDFINNDKYKFVESDKFFEIKLENVNLDSENKLTYISCSGKKNEIKFYDNLTLI